MNELEPTWDIAFKVWWSIMWRLVAAAAGAFVALMGIVILIILFTAALRTLPDGDGEILNRYLAHIPWTAILIPLQIWAILLVLRKKDFKTFRIAILPKSPDGEAFSSAIGSSLDATTESEHRTPPWMKPPPQGLGGR